MADIALVESGNVRVVRPVDEYAGVAGETIAAGALVRFDTSTGRVFNGNGSSAAEARIIGVATKDAVIYQPVTVLRQGVMDGFVLDGLNFGVDLYASDTDATIGTTAGTVSKIIGYVEAAWAGGKVTADRVLYVNLPAR